MQIFSSGKTYNIMGKSVYCLVISAVLFLGSVGLLVTKGLNYGVDFLGGTLIQIKYDAPANIDLIRSSITKDALFRDASVTKFGSDEEIIIKFSGSSENISVDVADVARGLLAQTGNFEIRRVDMVGPKVGAELREKGIMAMIISILAILAYISFRFEWRFAIASVIALVHDITIVAGALVAFNIDVNLDILAAFLTILGYSLNDTIIVFDRIRESIKTLKTFVLSEIINFSISKTLSRTILTSLTTFFVVFTLYTFGGEIIQGFAFTLLVGVVIGTYSSIYVASPVLQIFKFDVKGYRAKESEKQKKALEKEKLRAQYEKGIV